MTYYNYSIKVLTALHGNPKLFNRELLKGLYWMQINNEPVEKLIEWVEYIIHKNQIEKNEVNMPKKMNYEN